ncbi:unnamed protein product [Caenorhabditis auriculariae]|uniref:Zinc metalloproteinase n=1 Tax=Caenorhabditis auriculariae TaxID=2777116 RepID=A0A8S1GQK3_9PELO|nr:unnamed protein product [Caenorhabditis auriculariae]
MKPFFLLLIFVAISDAQNNEEQFQNLLTNFFSVCPPTTKITPRATSNFATPVSTRYVDKTEYAINRRILSKVFESDLVLTKPQMDDVIDTFRTRVTGTQKRIKRNAAIEGQKYRWPDAVVPYKFKDNDTEWQSIVKHGMYKWQKETCIRFRRHTTEKDYAIFFRGGGCYSNVGRTGGRQYISIGYGCEGHGIVAHEIGHALGFWHEQSRPDRDIFVNINEQKILKGTQGNFEKRVDLEESDIPYDFGSVMHYGPQAFTSDWKYVTIETKDHRFQHTIGQRGDVSFTDVKHANRLYCSHICKTSLSCENGGYENPLDCSSCKCPAGLGGTRCERIAPSTPGCGGELLATEYWQTIKNTQVGNCHWRIFAPSGKVHFEIIETKYKCDSSCAENYLEIKHSRNMEQTGFRQCCNPVPGRIVSEGNQVVLNSISKLSPSNFTVRFILDSASALKPPPAAWEGNGGLTGLLGANEAGFDNTFEHVVLKDLPRALK